MFIQRFNKRVAWCVSYGHKDFFLSFPSALFYIQLSFFDIDCPIRKPFAKTLWQKKREGTSHKEIFLLKTITHYKTPDGVSLSLSCVYTDSIELFWGLCGSKADGMRIHQLAALQLCRPRLECFLFFPFWVENFDFSSSPRHQTREKCLLPTLTTTAAAAVSVPEHDELEYYTVVGIR